MSGAQVDDYREYGNHYGAGMSISALLQPVVKELSPGFMVRRLLPNFKRQSIGPFLFFDHFGPVDVAADDNHDVRPHPHIGLATVTYLYEGAMMHRDSLGIVQRIEPGAINLMTAGSGIVHSERTPDDLRGVAHRTHGLQLWLALPQAMEECAPSFSHTPAADIPSRHIELCEIRVLIGNAFDMHSPVPTYSETLYLDISMPVGGQLELPALAQEMGIYLLDGHVQLDDTDLTPGVMALLDPTGSAMLRSDAAARFVIIGGAPLDGPRFISWNFVSSRRERILQASEDWAAQRMATIPGETEWIVQPGRIAKA